MKKEWTAKLDGRRWTEQRIINEIIKSRNIKDLEEFVSPTAENLIPFELMKNISKAGMMVLETIKSDGKILILYDVDCDGVSAGTIMYRYLSNYTDKVDTYINDGKIHGITTLCPVYQQHYDLLIVVDSIENDPAVYNYVLQTGCKLVVLDHHEIPDEILNIQTSINLVSSMNNYPNPALSGAGVCLKFALFLDSITGNDFAESLYDLGATGICGDMMDLSQASMENRYICKRGFENVRNPAINAINGNYSMDSTAVSFGIAPLINAGMRTNHNVQVMDLFKSDDAVEIADIITDLKSYKNEQNTKIDELFGNALPQLAGQENNNCLFFSIDGSESVAGLLANKLANTYNKPTIVMRLSEDGKNYTGSIRGVGIDDFASYVNATRVGKALGHSNAAGFRCPVDKIEIFKDRLVESMSSVELVKKAEADIMLRSSQITKSLINSFKTFNKISGMNSPAITVMIDGVISYQFGNMSNGKHLKVETPNMLFIKWNFNEWDKLEENKTFSAVGTLDCGYFGRKFYLQMIMEDFKFEEKINIDEI